MTWHSVLWTSWLLAVPTYAFYLPGAAPKNYKKGENVDLYVNALTPMLASTDNAKLVRLTFIQVGISTDSR